MNGQVVAFAGPIGSRKSELSRALAERLHWPRRSFGDFLRGQAKANAMDAGDRAVLQQLGQARVQSDPDRFVADVLEGHDWAAHPNLVLDGLRHAEVRHALLLQLAKLDIALRLVFVDIEEPLRQRQAEERGVPLRLLATYDRDLTEAQVSRVIRAYADIVVPGSLPFTVAVDTIVSRLSLRETSPGQLKAALHEN